jgi:uncharacterized protein with HEPN domain
MDSVEEYVGSDRAAFLVNRMARDAVLRQLQVMAESSQRVPEELKAKYPAVEWRALAAFRNVLVHNYLGVDVEQALKAYEQNAPILRRSVEQLLEELGEPRS